MNIDKSGALRHLVITAVSVGIAGVAIGAGAMFLIGPSSGASDHVLQEPGLTSEEEALGAGLASRLEDLRGMLETLEARHRDMVASENNKSEGKQNSPPVDNINNEFEARLAIIEAALAELPLRDASPGDQAGNTHRLEAEAITKLGTHMLDESLSVRIRLESLEVLSKLTPEKQPFDSVQPGAVVDFASSIRGPEWREKAFRYLRGHMTAGWDAPLISAMQSEKVDGVQEKLVELLAERIENPVVRDALTAFQSSGAAGKRARDSLSDALR